MTGLCCRCSYPSVRSRWKTSGREAFVHYSAINGKGYRKLSEGDVVEMTVEKGDKGLKAVSVVLIEPAST